MSGRVKDGIMKTYKAGKRYLAFRETKEGRDYLNTFALRRACLGSWRMAGLLGLLLIKTCIMEGRKRKI